MLLANGVSVPKGEKGKWDTPRPGRGRPPSALPLETRLSKSPASEGGHWGGRPLEPCFWQTFQVDFSQAAYNYRAALLQCLACSNRGPYEWSGAQAVTG